MPPESCDPLCRSHSLILTLPQDWDGDGVCDIIWSNPTNGNLRVWINDYVKKKTWAGAFREITPPVLTCDQKRGIGFDDCE